MRSKNNSKSLFSRYYSVCVSVLLATIVVLGIVLMAFVTQYFRADKYRLLSASAKQSGTFTARYIAELGYFQENVYYLNSKQQENILSILTMLANNNDSTIFLTQSNGVIFLCTNQNMDLTAYQVPQYVMQAVDQYGEYREVGTLGGIYKEKYYTVAVPMKVSVNGETQTIGYVYASSSSESLTLFLTDVLNMFLLSSVAVLVLSFIIIYYVTRRLVLPLNQMSAATKSFSKGEFSQRIPVDGDDEIAQLAVAFNNMASSLSVLESSRRSFVANVSHELKTPMTTIGGFIDGILDGTIPEEKHRYYLNIVSQEVKRLSRLVRSMLNIARIEAGEMKINPAVFDIHDQICQTVFLFEQAIESKHVEILGLDSEKELVRADPDLIHQVVYNLIENATKFVNEGGYIEFKIYTDRNMTYVSVKNSGEGISGEEVSHIFDRFYKTDKSRSVDKNGVGLGLHIVKSIINLHSGDITVRSAEGQYVEFVFSLPSGKEHGNIFKKQ